MQGIVKEVIYNDSDSENLYSILVEYNTSAKASRSEYAFPLDTNIKRVPVIGEVVSLVKGMSSDSSPNVAKPQYYFTTPISLQKNINHNALPKGYSKLESGGANSDGYADASAGNPNASSTQAFSFDFGFEEVSGVSALQPFSGDILIEGRFGQSIRQGYTPSGTQTTQTPSWSGESTSPITILRNTQNSSGWNKFVIEDVNEDDTSLYMTSKQKISLSQAHPFSLGVKPANLHGDPQFLVNSDRVLLNAKKDRVILAGTEDVNISTPAWKAAMDNMFTQIDEIKNELDALNNAVLSFAGGTSSGGKVFPPPPTGGPNVILAAQSATLAGKTSGIKGKIAKITAELNLMKQ
tara:strand:- start:12307 stop:13359 length:1053 start_codon:yes stop_codon:yes gene_type:complete